MKTLAIKEFNGVRVGTIKVVQHGKVTRREKCKGFFMNDKQQVCAMWHQMSGNKVSSKQAPYFQPVEIK